MATVNLTLKQILGAVEQHSPDERKRVQRELARGGSSPKSAHPVKQMPPRRAKRLSELLLKANSATLTAAEDAELNTLVDEFESLTLAGAEALARNKDLVAPASRPRRSTKR